MLSLLALIVHVAHASQQLSTYCGTALIFLPLMVVAEKGWVVTCGQPVVRITCGKIETISLISGRAILITAEKLDRK